MERRPSPQFSRRRLLAGGLALGAASCAAEALAAGSAAADTPTQSPAELMSAVMTVELMAVFAYDQILGSNKLGAAAILLASRFLAHEREHVSVIGEQLNRLGIAQPSGVSDAAAADQVLSAHGSSVKFESLNSEKDALTLLQQVESVAEGAYYKALVEVQDAGFIGAALQIMAVEAQHWTALTQLKVPGMINTAVPNGFVQGTYR